MTSAEQQDEEMLVQREDSGAGGGERQIQIHPLVIVNVADHQTRQKCNSQLSQTEAPQVIGALFGIQKGLDVDVYDSFEMKYDVGSSGDPDRQGVPHLAHPAVYADGCCRLWHTTA